MEGGSFLVGWWMVDRISETAWTAIIMLGVEFQKISQGGTLRKDIVDAVLTISRESAELSVLNQVKLVWEFSYLKAVQCMNTFILSYCRALEVPALLEQAVQLKAKWLAATDTDTNFAYSKVRS